VFRHFAQAAREGPERLAAAFEERQPTVDASIGYLENLASNYARLYPQPVNEACDVNAVVRQTIRLLGDPAPAELRMELADGLPPVRTDALVLRRIVENLTRNALDSLPLPGTGRVTVSTAPGAATDGQPTVRIVVADTGRGMTETELNRAFDAFYTTKPGGSGLGLSIVRRLVLDANGALRVETEPGAGSRFMIELPGASA